MSNAVPSASDGDLLNVIKFLFVCFVFLSTVAQYINLLLCLLAQLKTQ